MGRNESLEASKSNLCERNYDGKRKNHVDLMRKLISRFKDKNKDYTEEWQKTELEEIIIDIKRQINNQCLNQDSEEITVQCN